jgi:hypothetical protein
VGRSHPGPNASVIHEQRLRSVTGVNWMNDSVASQFVIHLFPTGHASKWRAPPTTELYGIIISPIIIRRRRTPV